MFIPQATEVPKVPEVLRVPEMHNWPILNVISSIAEMIPKLFSIKLSKLTFSFSLEHLSMLQNFFLLIVGKTKVESVRLTKDY